MKNLRKQISQAGLDAPDHLDTDCNIVPSVHNAGVDNITNPFSKDVDGNNQKFQGQGATKTKSYKQPGETEAPKEIKKTRKKKKKKVEVEIEEVHCAHHETCEVCYECSKCAYKTEKSD